MKAIALVMLGISTFGISFKYNTQFLDWLRFQSLGTRDYIVQKLSLMFIDIPAHRILIGLFCMSFGLGSLVFLAFLPNLFPGIMFGSVATIVGWKAPKPLVDWIYRRRVKKFVVQMVDALSLMSNGLKSGLSVVQSLGVVTQEMPNPIQQEFNLILSQNKLGVSIEDAFNGLATRIKSDDVEMFVTSVNILKETGGNLAETFDTIITTIRDRIKVEQKIDALTSQGFIQGLFVMAIPPIMGVVFFETDPDYMRPMFTTTIGWLLVLVIFMLEAVGFFVIMKIIKIDV
jgi:tight adherence protein B